MLSDTQAHPGLLLNGGDAARLLGLSRSKFYRADSAGHLGPQGVRIGTKRLWRTRELEAWVARGCPPRTRWVWPPERGEGSRP